MEHQSGVSAKPPLALGIAKSLYPVETTNTLPSSPIAGEELICFPGGEAPF